MSHKNSSIFNQMPFQVANDILCAKNVGEKHFLFFLKYYIYIIRSQCITF